MAQQTCKHFFFILNIFSGLRVFDVKKEKMTVVSFPYKDMWKGLFKAPATGKYRFYISGDDASSLMLDAKTPYKPSMLETDFAPE